MAKVALTVGAYQSRTVVASAQRCVNLYMEKNPDDSAFPFTCYPTPGTTLLSTAGAAQYGWRGLYTGTDGQLYGVCQSTLYLIAQSGALTVLGGLTSYTGAVSMVDNGTTLIVVDGTTYGYQYTLGTVNSFAVINQDSFYGGDTISFTDGYFIVNRPNSVEWYISGVDTAIFDSLDFASKSAYLDKLVGLCTAGRYIYLFGTTTTEVWFNSGATAFPFSRLPGVYIQFGCSSPATIQQMNSQVFWLTQSPQGEALVCTTNNYQAVIISTHALSYELSTYATLADALSFTYLLNGHMYYVLNFPTADKTWQYDLSTQQWNELVWLDIEGIEHRHRANCHAFAYGIHFVGDWQTGNLYKWDNETYTDNGNPILRLRSFPHSLDNDMNRVLYREFIADMAVGNGDGSNNPVPVALRWSDTRGASWGNPIYETIGAEGDYLRSVQFQRLGMSRDRVFELSWSANVKTSLSGAFVKAKSANE